MTKITTITTYLNETDGLQHCSKCNSPCEVIFEGKKHNCLCDCQEQERRVQQDIRDRKEKAQKIASLRKDCITQPLCRAWTFENDNHKDPKTISSMKKIWTNIKQFVDKGMGILLWGNVGMGKSYAAYCLVNKLIDNLIPVYCTSLSKIVQLAQKWDEFELTMRRILAHKFILIDDFGTERDTSFAQERAYEFINECITRNIVLIITTNLPPYKLQAAASDISDLNYARLYSRILERCLPLKVNNVRQRVENQQSNYAEMLDILKKK